MVYNDLKYKKNEPSSCKNLQNVGLTFLLDRHSLTPNRSTTFTMSHSIPPGCAHDQYYYGGDRNWSASSESNGGVLFLPPASTRLHNTTKGQASSMGSMTVPTWTTATFQQLYFRLSLQLTNSDHELTLTMATPRPQSSSASYRHLISYFARGLKERPTTWK